MTRSGYQARCCRIERAVIKGANRRPKWSKWKRLGSRVETFEEALLAVSDAFRGFGARFLICEIVRGSQRVYLADDEYEWRHPTLAPKANVRK